ncbi:MAG: endonuclease/exonuclease/phosphatase family protein, partial [Bacteroidota bacterium]
MNSAIIQWNMASYYSNFEELKVLIREQCNPQVFCLQETRNGTKTILPPSGYNCIQSHSINNETNTRGVCLLINKSSNYKTLPLKISGNVEAVAARVWLDDKYYSICSIYLSPSLIIQEKDITEILDQLPQPYLLLGDMNARHSLWGEEINNTKGNLFENLLM